ncbi:hypothetical protein D3C75_1015580 [compost metagenome]
MSDFVRITQERCIALDDSQLEYHAFIINFGQIAIRRPPATDAADFLRVTNLEPESLDITAHVFQGDDPVFQVQEVERCGVAASGKKCT